MANAISFLLAHPALWPGVLLGLFAPIHLLRTNPTKQSAHFTRREARVLVAGGFVCLCLFAFSVCSYLFSSTFLDLWESLSASLASVLLQGGAVYPALTSQERYASPYGPFLYLTIALSQWIMGPSEFATKLPCAAAGLTATALVWTIVHRQSRSAGIAFVFAGLQAALLLAFRIQAFWPKPDGLILLGVTIGLITVLRRGVAWQLLLGFCIGAAIDLKPHAVAYFLPLLALAHHRGWRLRAFVVSGVVALLAAALPYLAQADQFSLTNYLRLLLMTVHEGFAVSDALDFLKWVCLLAALVLVADHWQLHPAIEIPPDEQRFRFWYRCAILIGVALVAVPGAAVGAGPRHLMPFLPLVVYDVSLRFSAGAVRSCGPDRPIWRLFAYCALASCFMVAVQTAARLFDHGAAATYPSRAAQAEIHRVLSAHRDCTVLMGAGNDQNTSLTLFRHQLVFAGHPIGIDIASAMDYRKAGLSEPNLGELVEELRRRRNRPLLWIIPRGEPFSLTSIYNGQPLFSDSFRRDFRAAFALQEQTEFFDVYAPVAAEQVARVEKNPATAPR